MGIAYSTQLPKRVLELYNSSPEMRNWLDRFGKFKSPRTVQDYGENFKQFVDYTRKTPKQLLTLKPKEIYELLEDWSDAKIKDGVAEATLARRWISILSFFKFHEKDNILVKGKREIPFKKNKNKYLDLIPTQQQLKRIIDATPHVSTKIAIELMAYAGIRPEDVVELIYGSIKEDFEKGILPCSVWVMQEKTKRPYVTFLPESTVKLLREYISLRRGEGEKITESTPLIRDQHTKEVVKGIRRKVLTAKIETAFKRSGVPIMENRGAITKRLRPYSLRKYFSSKLSGKVPIEYIRAMRGHIDGLDAIYGGQRDLDDDIIEKMRISYSHGLESLVAVELEGGLRQVEEVNKLKNHLEEQEKRLENQSKKIEKLMMERETDALRYVGIIVKQKIIPENELQEWFKKGWHYKNSLNNGSGKCIIELQTTKPSDINH